MSPINPRKFVPTGFNFILLFVVWLLLTNSYSVGNVLMAGLVSWFILFLTSGLHSTTEKVQKPGLAAKYILNLIWDIIESNLVVAKQVLGPVDELKPGFVAIPLDLTGELPITLLASTISLTPGTVSTEVSEDHKTLYVHALNVDNEQDIVDTIKSRYERPLMEIFGC